MESNSAAMKSGIIYDFPKLPKLTHWHWRWYRCIPLVLLIVASKNLVLQQLGWLTTAPSLAGGFLTSFDYYFSSCQNWLEGPDKFLELVAAYSIIFISLFILVMAFVSAFFLGNVVKF